MAKLSKNTVLALMTVGLLGLFAAVHTVSACIQNFSWPELIIYLLYVASFAWLFTYTLDETVSSAGMFRHVLFFYGASLALTGIIFPAPAAVISSSVVSFLCLLVICLLVVVSCKWQEVKLCKGLFLFILVAQFCLSLRDCIMFISRHAGDESIISAIGSWIPFALSLCLAICYSGRMKVKAGE